MPGKKSRNKGADFERKVAKILSEALSLELRRTPLSGGWARGNPGVAGDIVCVDPGPEALPYCIECKNNEKWRLVSLFTGEHKWFDDWWAQLDRECPDDKAPLLVFSKAYTPDFVSFRWLDITVDISIYVEWTTPSYLQSLPHLTVVLPDGRAATVMLLDDFLDLLA